MSDNHFSPLIYLKLNFIYIFFDSFTKTKTVAWFTLDPELSNSSESGMYFSQNDTVVTVDGWEHRVGLGSVGFSRGVHYWEFTIEKYVPDTDPAFGVARIDVARDKMLGKYVYEYLLKSSRLSHNLT